MQMIWDKHASSFGICCLLVCLASAYFYKQAPLRTPKEDDEDEGVPLTNPDKAKVGPT
jgi:hypothetical protein